MTSVFISHSGHDHAVAAEVGEWLRAEGYRSIFLDFDPSAGIPAGRRWERELRVQLHRADAVVFLGSPESVASRWCFAELATARWSGRPVLPVRLARGVRLELLDDVQWIEPVEGGIAYNRLREGLRRNGLRPADSFAWDPDRSPYPGLEPFRAQDAAVFFGRGPETDRLVDLLRTTSPRGAGRLVAVVGPSGSGKSSLLRAGLLPRLERIPERWCVVPPMLPGRQPIKSLARGLAKAFGGAYGEADLADRLACGPSELVDLADELSSAGEWDRRAVLVVVDQAEELVTLTGPEGRGEFLALLRGALHEDSPLWIVATLRSEFLSGATDRAGLAEAVDDAVLVEPLSRARLPEVIQLPARRAGITFAAGLVERMVEDTVGGDALPLLACTLQQLHQRVGDAGAVEFADYEALGGVVGSLRRQADLLDDALRRRGRGDLVLPTLLKLVTVDALGEPTRRRADRRSLTAEEDAVVQAFVDARLLTSDSTGAEVTVEVAHEALLRQWAPLTAAIAASGEALRMRSDLERLAGDWRSGGQDDSYLLRGVRLTAFEEWAARHGEPRGEVDRAYFEASRALARREAEAAAERDRARLRLQAESFGRSALVELDRSPEDAVLLALVAVATDGGAQAPAVIRSAHSALDGVRLRRVLRDHEDRVSAVAFSPDGRRLVTGSYDGTARIRNSPDGAGVVVLTGHTDHVVCVAWSPDGSRVATGGWDGTARIWHAGTGDCLGTLRGHDSWVSGVSWSPDGTRLATASHDNTAAVWTVDAATVVHRFRGHEAWVRSAEWRPDGRRLLTGSYDGTAAVWDTRTGKRLRLLQGHRGPVPAVRWSPDGQHAVTASEDGTIRVWAASKGTLERTVEVHSSPTFCLDLDHEGVRVATGSEDGVVRVFDLATGVRVATLPGHRSWVSSVAWSPDGEWIASGSGDATTRVVNLLGRERFTAQTGGDAWISSVRWHPDGTRTARASADGTLRIGPVDGGPADDVVGEGSGVLCLAWHPGGVLLATGGFSGEIRVIDTEALLEVGAYPRHDQRVTAVDWHPGGDFFATCGEGGVVLVVDAATGEVLRRLDDAVPQSVRWSPDGDLLAVGGWDNAVHLWSPFTESMGIRSLTGHTAALHDIAWAPDGDRFVTTSGDGFARIWSASEEREVGRLAAGEAFAVGWSRDGRFIATGSRDGKVRIWDAATAKPVQELVHQEGMHALDWSPDGERLLVGGEQGGVRVWRVGHGALTRELVDLAEAVVADDAVREYFPRWPDLDLA